MNTIYAWIAGVIVSSGALFGLWYTIHTKPLSTCNNLVITRDAQLLEVSNLMSEAYAKLYVAESNGSVMYISGIIVGVENEEDNSTIDFNNFYY